MLGIIKWDLYGDISHFFLPPNWLRGHFSARVERNSKKNKQNFLQESPKWRYYLLEGSGTRGARRKWRVLRGKGRPICFLLNQ